MADGGYLGNQIQWVDCVSCSGSFYCEAELIHMDIQLICPFCETEFKPEDGIKKREENRALKAK